MYDFNYIKPSSVAEATAALADEDAQAMSGGQTLVPTLKARLAAPTAVVDLSGVSEMQGVSSAGGSVRIGGLTTHHDVANSADVSAACSALAGLAGAIGDPSVRHRGTIGGSVANNDPSADYPAACLGLGATVHTSGGDISADDFFVGMFETALGEGQIVTGITFPGCGAANYQKFVQPASRFALVGVFVANTASGPRVAVTGASESGVFRWGEAEAALAGSFAAASLDGLSLPADGMIGDLHGSAEYRAHLVGVMAKRAVAAC
jgi:carbon-monoxide dehydrogenase medium subunit